MMLTAIRAVLDEEVVGLAERYRAPFVLASMEGLSPAEAGAELGLSEAAVLRRLARARSLLAERLARRGVALSAALCALALGERTRATPVPRELSDMTLRLVKQLATEGRTERRSAE
jgi:hypothetical protein